MSLIDLSTLEYMKRKKQADDCLLVLIIKRAFIFLACLFALWLIVEQVAKEFDRPNSGEVEYERGTDGNQN